MSNLKKYNKTFIEVFDVSQNELNGEFKIGESENWDSFGHITLITQLEEEFDIMFDSEDVLNFESYENGKEVFKKYDIIIN